LIPCIVIGDSLAVGVGQNRPHCETFAKVGITSQQYIDSMLDHVTPVADSAVISLGVNDDPRGATLANLRIVRSRLHVRQAYWLLPGIKEDVRRIILQVAREYHDRTVDTRPLASADHLHPTGQGYQILAAWTGEAGLHLAQLPQVQRP